MYSSAASSGDSSPARGARRGLRSRRRGGFAAKPVFRRSSSGGRRLVCQPDSTPLQSGWSWPRPRTRPGRRAARKRDVPAPDPPLGQSGPPRARSAGWPRHEARLTTLAGPAPAALIAAGSRSGTPRGTACSASGARMSSAGEVTYRAARPGAYSRGRRCAVPNIVGRPARSCPPGQAEGIPPRSSTPKQREVRGAGADPPSPRPVPLGHSHDRPMGRPYSATSEVLVVRVGAAQSPATPRDRRRWFGIARSTGSRGFCSSIADCGNGRSDESTVVARGSRDIPSSSAEAWGLRRHDDSAPSTAGVRVVTRIPNRSASSTPALPAHGRDDLVRLAK